jgi:hypothetical protein
VTAARASLFLMALGELACASARPVFRPVPPESVIVSEVTDALGDGARTFDPEAREYTDGPDLVGASAALALAPGLGPPSLMFRMRLAPSELGAWRARFFVTADLDSTPATPSYQHLKGVSITFTLSDREAFVRRGPDLMGRVPVVVEPTWGSGRVGQDRIEVSVPVEWLMRDTHAPLPARRWREWLGNRGRPLSYRITVSTNERYNERADSVPDDSLPPALLPVPGW